MQEMFAVVHDTRHPGHTKHKLCDILTITMCAVMCGQDELWSIYAYAQNKAELFRERFGIKSIPSKATFSRVLASIDGKEVADLVINHMKQLLGEGGDIIAVDGKAIRSTSKEGVPHSAIQILTAYLTESGVVLGQEKIYQKTNEIPTFQETLSYLNVAGKTVTADAMHCQRETCKKVIKKHGNYVFGLKENQKTLYDDVALYFEDKDLQNEMEIYTTIEKNKGRIEQRVCRKASNIDWLIRNHSWPGLKTVFAVDRTITKSKGTTKETSYYISSSDDSADRLLSIARNHWGIESMHWMLDVVFSEDDCILESEDAHVALNAFRKYALAMHRNYITQRQIKQSKRSHMIKCLMNDNLMLQILTASG